MDSPSIPSAPLDRGTRLFQRAFLAGLLLAVVAIAFIAGFQKGRSGSVFMTETPISPNDAVFTHTQNPDAEIDFSLFWRVWNILKDKYIDREQLNAKALFYGAIDGMLAASGDPYTTFFDPEEQRSFQEEMEGTFDGIGAEMAIRDDILTIVAPLDDSPAERAGLMPHDRILKIDDESTVNLSIEEAVSRIRGPRGTEVKLTIFRNGEEEAREITIKRDLIVVKSVKLEIRDGLAILRISRFGDDTIREVDQTIGTMQGSKIRGIVLDLRNNPGGYLEGAVAIAHHFLKDGTVVVQQEYADDRREPLRSSGRPTFESVPMIVLINEGSASASEILAGALREKRGQVTLVGKKSFGKGSVQELIPTGKDTAVKITVARWLTPEGHQINEVGISPDLEVSLTREDVEAERDPQLDRALELLREELVQ